MAELPLVSLYDEEELPLVELPLVDLDEEDEEPARYLYNDDGTVAGINPAAAPSKQDSQSWIRGLGQTLGRGQLAGGADEVVGAVRAAADNLLVQDYDFGDDVDDNPQSLKKAYEMYRDEARDVQDEFAEENPKTALAAEVIGGIASPINKVMPGAGTKGNLLQRTLASGARGTAEGGLTGFLEGEGSLEDQLDNAYKMAMLGGGISTALTGGAGGVGRQISKRRVDESLYDAAGNFKPIHMADPESSIGKFYRNVVGNAFGGRGALGKQESAALNANPRLARFADDAGEVVPGTVGTKNAVSDMKDRAVAGIDRQIDSSKRASKGLSKARKDATERINQETTQQAKAAKRQAVDQAGVSAKAIDDSGARELLKQSIPASMPPELRQKILNNQDFNAAEEALSDWWTKSAFKDVKNQRFRMDRNLIKRIRNEANNNKELKKDLQSAVGGVKRLKQLLEPAKVVTGDMDVAEAMTAGGIDGDTLMELRNTYARSANAPRPTLKGKASRTVADEFDDMIKRAFGGEKSPRWLQYKNELDTYATKQAVTKAANTARKNLQDSPTTKQIGSKLTGAEAAKDSRRLAKSVNDRKEALKGQATKAGQDASDQTRSAGKARLEAAKADIDKKTSLEMNKKRRLDDAKRAAKNRIDRESQGTLPEDSSAWSMLSATAALGAPFAGLGVGAIPAGYAVSRGLSTEGAQRMAAGQTGIQELINRQLQSGEGTSKVTRNLARAIALQAAEEEEQ